MKHILLLLASAASSVLSLKIVNVSRNKIVRQGEDAVLFCQTDEPFDSCSWTLPTGVSCSSSQNQCRRAGNVYYNGTESNCQVLIKKVPDSLSGSWMCSVVKDGVTRNSTQVNLVEAQPAAVDWQGGVFGTFEVRWTTGDPKPSLICEVKHSRPAGRFRWFLGEEKETEVENSSPASVVETSNGFVEMSQVFTFDPSPDYTGKKLFCEYIQEDENGRELYVTDTNIELESHYLAPAPNNLVVQSAEEGQDLQIKFKFVASPVPGLGNIVWRIDNPEANSERNIPVEEEDRVIENYVVHSLVKDDDYEFTARLTIKNISKAEREKNHMLVLKSRLSPNTPELQLQQEFDVQVDTFEFPQDPESSSSSTIIIVVVIVILLIAIIVTVILIVWSKKNSRWCFAGEEAELGGGTHKNILKNNDASEQKEPLQVQHHPYARPSS